MDKYDRALFDSLKTVPFLERIHCYCGMPTVWVDQHGCRYAPKHKVDALLSNTLETTPQTLNRSSFLVNAEFDPRPLWFVCRCGRSIEYDVVMEETNGYSRVVA